MKYSEMAQDILRYADQRNIEKLTLIGHNIGGKTAMTLSCLYPERVSAIISLDTIPFSFRNNQLMFNSTLKQIEDIRQLNIQGKTRKNAIEIIQKNFKDIGIANLVASNLVYDPETENKTVKWCINFQAITDNFSDIVGFNDELKLN